MWDIWCWAWLGHSHSSRECYIQIDHDHFRKNHVPLLIDKEGHYKPAGSTRYLLSAHLLFAIPMIGWLESLRRDWLGAFQILPTQPVNAECNAVEVIMQYNKHLTIHVPGNAGKITYRPSLDQSIKRKPWFGWDETPLCPLSKLHSFKWFLVALAGTTPCLNLWFS